MHYLWTLSWDLWKSQTLLWPWLGATDHVADYAPVSTVQMLVVTQQPLCLSSPRPPAASKQSIRKLRRAACVPVWQHWRHAMHFIIPGRPGFPQIASCPFPNSREWKNMSSNGFPIHACYALICQPRMTSSDCFTYCYYYYLAAVHASHTHICTAYSHKFRELSVLYISDEPCKKSGTDRGGIWG